VGQSGKDELALCGNSLHILFLEGEIGYASEVWVNSKEWISGMLSGCDYLKFAGRVRNQ
jgi:hypothetical protein